MNLEDHAVIFSDKDSVATALVDLLSTIEEKSLGCRDFAINRIGPTF